EIEARNTADNMAYQAEKVMREQGDKIPADIKEEVQGKIAAVRSALQGQDVDHLRRTVEELTQSLQKVGQAVYQQQSGPQPPPGGGPPPPGGKPGEGTVEGDFREV
ncbi:MAG: Hsp70 family protein, partial [Chloroflexi bacterium]|nr:Hsp70 family protein [Chloroflexota bacterium]